MHLQILGLIPAALYLGNIVFLQLLFLHQQKSHFRVGESDFHFIMFMGVLPLNGQGNREILRRTSLDSKQRIVGENMHYPAGHIYDKTNIFFHSVFF